MKKNTETPEERLLVAIGDITEEPIAELDPNPDYPTFKRTRYRLGGKSILTVWVMGTPDGPRMVVSCPYPSLGKMPETLIYDLNYRRDEVN